METVKVYEPVVNVKPDVEKNHIVFKGAMRYTQQVNVADSYSNAQALFTINPPSTQTITDREMKIRCYLEVETDQDLQLGTNDALRQYPIHSITDVLTVQINGESISDNVSDKLHALLCYGTDYKMRQRCSTSPSQPDAYQEYSDWQVYGSAKNPLADYGESPYDPRGGFVVEVISARKFRAVVTEPIFMSPFMSGYGPADEGFVNVNQFNIAYRFKSNLSQVLSHSSAGNAITNVTVDFYQAPEILTTFLTPDLSMKLPQLQTLPYHKSQDYIKRVEPLAAGSSTTIYSDSIKLSQIPRKVYLYVRHERNTSNQNTSDSFLSIENVNILWNNQSGLLANATQQDLYNICSRNGLDLSWSQFKKHRGSVLCLHFGKDIGLLDNEAPGVQGQYTMQVQLRVKNESSNFFTGDFFTVFMMEGTFSIAENMGRASLGNLTKEVVLATQNSPELGHAEYENIQGGSFWSNLKNTVRKVSRGIQKGAKVVGDVAEHVPFLAPVAGVARTVGDVAGVANKLSGGRVSGGGYNRKMLKRR